MLRTFAKAGSYLFKDDETSKPVMNVNMIPIEEHLIMARKFVLEWMNRRNPPREDAVIRQLARIDLHLRQRWWRNYVDNPTWTFTKAIQAAEFLADNQSSFDCSTNLYHGALREAVMAPPRTGLGAKLRSQALLKDEAKGEKVKAVKARARKRREAKAALE